MLKIHIGNFGVILLFSLSNLKTFVDIYVATFLNSKDTFDLITILKPIWNPVEKLWIKYIETALASNDDEFEAINEKAKNELGESFLQFAGRTGKFHLSKVNDYELNMYRGISWYTFTRYIVYLPTCREMHDHFFAIRSKRRLEIKSRSQLGAFK